MGGTPLGPGSLLAGRFALDDLLDESEGARLWRATDRVLARSVAVHVLASSDARAEAVLTAARTSALVSDVRLLRVLDAAAENGVVYVVNEWGAGVSLDRLVADGPLAPRRAAWVAREVADAIATAHRHGVAHGRLLPENVMVTEAGSVKVIGFVVSSVLHSTPDFTHQRVTGGEPLDAFEADVVNLGALLYTGLVGRWPGTEGSVVAPAPAEHGRPLRPRQVRAGVPRPLDAICERVLNGDQHSQVVPLHSAHEVYAALSDYIGDGVAADAVDAPTVGRSASGAAGAAGAAASAGGDPDATTAIDHDDLFGEPAEPDTEETPTQDGTAPTDPDATQAGVPAFADDTSGMPAAPGGGRPLFADEGVTTTATGTGTPGPPAGPAPARAAGPAAEPDPGSDRGVGGSGDAGRPPEPEPAPWPEQDRSGGRPGGVRRGLRLAVVVCALLLVAVVVVVGLKLSGGRGGAPAAGGGSRGSSGPSPSAGPVRIADVSDFDPQGNPPRENPDLAPLAIDGHPSTSWHTSTYFDQFPKLKTGVGLLLDLGHPARVGGVRVRLEGRPTSLEVLAAPGAHQAPTTTRGLRTVATRKDAGTKVDLSLTKPVTTRWLVVWLTSLPRVSGGYEGTVSEVAVRS